MARAGVRCGRCTYCTAEFRKMPSPRRLVDAREDVGEAPAARRPAPLLEVLPQERVQWRTMEQIVDPVLEVPMLRMVVCRRW